MIGSDEVTRVELSGRDGVFIRKGKRLAPELSLHLVRTQRTRLSTSQEEVPHQSPIMYLYLRPPAFRIVRNEFLLLKLPVYGNSLWQPELRQLQTSNFSSLFQLPSGPQTLTQTLGHPLRILEIYSLIRFLENAPNLACLLCCFELLQDSDHLPSA